MNNEIGFKVETRGRPRKNIDERLPPISRKLFSEHCAVFYACCMVYVLEVFLKTKQEKRIGHSEGGFTIYEKINSVYCFDTFDEDIEEWGYSTAIDQGSALWNFTKTINGCAPKFVFRELVTLIVMIHRFLQSEKIHNIEDLQISHNLMATMQEVELNKIFKYIRFTPNALKELKMDKWSSQISKKSMLLWKPFLKVLSYTVLCVEKGIQKNKYLKPFFSDAEHPQDTIIGQLNLEQIVEEKQEWAVPVNYGFTKIAKSTQNEEIDKIKKVDYGHSPSSEIAYSNKRPITLITFPSNPKIETDATPVKTASHLNVRCEKDEGQQIEGNSESLRKIVKTE